LNPSAARGDYQPSADDSRERRNEPMTGVRQHITKTALALAAAVLATSMLQSEPAEARRGGAHSRMAKSHGSRPMHGRLTPHYLKPTKFLTSSAKTAGVGTIPDATPANPNGVPTTVGSGNLPHTPPINPGGAPPTGPGGGPKTVPFDPPGGPTPVPVPTSPNGGQSSGGGATQGGTAPFDPNGGRRRNASGGGQQKQAGAYAESGADGGHPCLWLKRKYDQTGNVEWFNRHTQCLAWHYAD
jgi:hypothetical protein